MTKATESKWQARVREWRSSGMTAEAFTAGRGFEASTLRWWSSRLVREGVHHAVASAEAPVAMARVVRLPPAAREAPLTIAIGRARVVVARGFDPALLREVVEALGERP